jgi:pimeloyl-ACP methyl ester carboxylesterase
MEMTMIRQKSQLSTVQLILVFTAIVLIVVSWWGVSMLEKGLSVTQHEFDGLSLRYIQPEGGYDLPAIIIAHGYGGSQQIMYGYAYAFAHSGYAVMMLDFSGHASNPAPLDFGRDSLQADIEKAYQSLITFNDIDEERIALLGHSMGSGAVMTAGINSPDKYSAVVAVSPTGAEVSESLPQNLMLQAGTLEGDFVENAKALLEEAGGLSNDFEGKTARIYTEIANVEHITILFNSNSHNHAVNWANQAFEIESQSTYRDTRILWYALHLIGWILFIPGVKPFIKFKPSSTPEAIKPLRKWLVFLLAPIVATLTLYLLTKVFNITSFMGLQVGGALSIWFLIMGLIWLFIGTKVKSPQRMYFSWGLLFFAVLFLCLGLMAQFTWMQSLLIPARIWRALLIALACWPWKLAASYNIQGSKGWKRIGLWLLQNTVLMSALIATAMYVPGMGILMLIAPVLPFIFLVEGVIGSNFDDPWIYSIGSSLLLGWLVSSFFPLI